MLENYVDMGKLIIVGDFNLDVSSDKDRYAHKLVEECALFGLNQLVKVPTRSTLTSDTIIDLVFSNFYPSIEVLTTPRVSDHNIIVINTHVIVEQENIIEKFNMSVTYALDVVAPKVTKILKPKIKDKKWITKDLIEKMKERDRLFFLSKNSGIKKDIDEYKRLRNYIVDELRKRKRHYNDDKIDANKSNGKILWKQLKDLIGNERAQTSIDGIEIDGRIVNDNLVISNEFNHYFVDSIEKILNSIDCISLHYENNDNSDNQKWDKFDSLDENDVDKIVKSLDDKKGYNNDVNSVIMKYLWNVDRNILLNILNGSLKSGVVPGNLKVSVIVPIQKIKDSIKISDFRPINTLPVIEQVLESIVKSQLDKFIDKNKILNVEQSGFRKGHSCETAMQCSLIDWRKNIDDGIYMFGHTDCMA
ncbi:uncharacterized protein LOC130674181 [Microplitis mediator]|uniref:uncharacterized protein LOC130674181 n=1 Tax=Microplitis mediator TaxID=375433 RepID=UPI00255780AA|nr:uncharacterized protein LOC130674181 [Microplitis mediator]